MTDNIKDDDNINDDDNIKDDDNINDDDNIKGFTIAKLLVFEIQMS